MKFSRRFKKLRSHSGITLMELLSTVVIIGIVSGMAVPRFQKAIERVKMKSADRQMKSSLRLARSLAVTEKQPFGVYFSNNYSGGSYSSARLYYVLFQDVANPGMNSYEAGDSIIRVDSLPGEFNMLVTDMTNDVVMFQPNGTASFTGGGNVVTMGTTDDVVAIMNHNVLASTGRIKSYSYIY
ncbi:MAG: GspH/FimT family pseudopilin [bacterium]|nr:GspH/FimT family pseudopilin [bacterium]